LNLFLFSAERRCGVSEKSIGIRAWIGQRPVRISDRQWTGTHRWRGRRAVAGRSTVLADR